MAIQFLNDAKFSRLHKLKFHSTGEITTTGASGTNFDISAIGSNTDLRFLADNDDGSSSVYFLLDASMADYSNPDYYTRFPDNSHLVFGNSANISALDFEIYHEGTTAYLQGDSNIYMASESNVTIQADNGVELRHGVGGSSRKFQTTTTGVDVTGTINLDNLTINGAQGSDGQVLTSTGTGIAWEDAAAGTSETAERIEVTVKNVSGGSLSKGTVVHASPSATPPSGNVIEVIAADYDDSTKMPAIGILNETIANEAEGAAVMMGAVSGIDTSSFSIGDELYVGNLGTLTNTKPVTAGQLIQKIAVVIKSHASNGLIKIFGAGRSNDVPLPLYIDNTNQRVGIGTTSPGYKLAVSNGTHTLSVNPHSAGIDLHSTGNLAPHYQTDFTLYTGAIGSGTARLRVDSSGNVGIGTTNPSNGKLQIDSTSNQISIETGTSGDGRLNIGHFSNGTFIGTYGDDGGAADLIRFGTHSGDERMRITSGGNIGINTTNPTRLLHIAKGSASAVITLQRTNANSGGSYGALQWTASDDHTVASIDARADGDNEGAHLLFHTTTAATSNDPYGINERMRITSTGDVGIGTTSPDSMLHLKSTGDVKLILEADSDNSGENDNPLIELKQDNSGIIGRLGMVGDAGQLFTNSRANSTGLGTVYQQDLIFFTENSARVYVKGENGYQGRVGIGTATPSHPFHVIGTGLASSDFRAPVFYDSNNTAYYVNPNSTSVLHDLDLKNNGILKFYRAGGNALQRADARVENSTTARLHWYGSNDSGGNTAFQHAWYDGSNYINVTASNPGVITFAGSAASMYIGSDRVFDDGYHPNADTWTTARTLSLTGDVTGSVSWDGSANASITTAVANNSHQHSKLHEESTITYGGSYLQWTDLSGNGGAGTNGNAPGNPFSDWHHHLIMNHGNSGGYYVDMAFSFHNDRVHFRRLENGSFGSWREFFHTGHVPTYSELGTMAYSNLTGTPSSLPANGGNSDTVDGHHASRFFRRIAKATATVGPGWMTVAENVSGRKAGEIVVTDADSGDHAYIRIEWMRSYGDSNFTVLNCGGHANRITGARVLYNTSDNTYGGKKLQVYVTTSSNYEVNIYEQGDIDDYEGHSVVTPVIQNTISGYAVHGRQLENLDTFGFAAEEGILSGGDLKVLGTSSGIHVDSTGHASLRLDRGSTSYDNNVLFMTNGGIKWRLWQDGSDDYLYIRNDSGTNNLMTFRNNNTVGINTGTPNATLHLQVPGAAAPSIFLQAATNFAPGIYFDDSNTGTSAPGALIYATANNTFSIKANSSSVVTISSGTNTIAATSDIVAYSSDKRLKENVQPINKPLNKVLKLEGVTYNWNKKAKDVAGFDTEIKEVGLFAQDVQKVLPEAVKLAPFDTGEDFKSKSGEDYLTVQYEKIVPLLVEAIKDQQKQIDELKSIINGSS